jgi:antirestriction protein
VSDFEASYRGPWPNEEEFAAALVEDCGDLDRVPEHLRGYIDYAALARDLFLDDYIFVKGFVFSRYY